MTGPRARPPIVRLAAADLFADRTRTLFGIGALVPLVVGYLVLAVVARGLLVVSSDPPAATNLLVVSSNVLDPVTGELNEEDLAAAAAAAGNDLERASGMLVRASDISDHLVQLRAAPPDTWEPVHGLKLVAGTWPAADDDIVVTEGVVAVTDWKVGDGVEVFGSRFRVAGLVRAAGTKFASLWMRLDRAERLFGVDGIYQVLVLTLTPGSDPDTVADRVASAPALADHALVVQEAAFLGQISRLVRFASSLGYLAALLALAALTFGVVNLVGVTLSERRRELGILRTLGLAPSRVRQFVGARSLLLAGLGYLAGLVVAVPVVARAPTVVLRSITVDLDLEPVTVLAGLVFTLVLAWVGAAGVAARALRHAPAELVSER